MPFERNAVGLKAEILISQTRCRVIVENEVDEVLSYLREKEGEVGGSRGLNVVHFYASICLRW